MLLFVGRIQPLKAPDLLVRATAELLREQPWRRSRLRVVVLGGPSGSGTAHPDSLADLVRSLGLQDVVRTPRRCRRAELADHYRAADVVAVPSYNESFGLVALEAQACATPVVAAAVGGLRTAVRDDAAGDGTGLLVPDHDPAQLGRGAAHPAGGPRPAGRGGRAGRAAGPGLRVGRHRRGHPRGVPAGRGGEGAGGTGEPR